jgi:hypothetical protein
MKIVTTALMSSYGKRFWLQKLEKYVIKIEWYAAEQF